MHVGADGVDDGVGDLRGLELGRVNGDHDLGQAHFGVKGTGFGNGVSVGQDGADHIQQDGKAAALPVADGQDPLGALDNGGVGGELTVFVIAAGHRELLSRKAGALQLAVAELGQGAVHHDVLAIGAGDRENNGVIAQAAVQRAPGGHDGPGVGPADADAACVRRLPAIGAAAHPVVVVAQGHHAYAKAPCQLHGPRHGPSGVQGPEAPVPVPALDGAEGGHALRLNSRVDLPVFQILDYPGKAVQPVGVYPAKAVLGENLRRVMGPLGGKAVFVQHARKLAEHGFIGNIHPIIPFLSVLWIIDCFLLYHSPGKMAR